MIGTEPDQARRHGDVAGLGPYHTHGLMLMDIPELEREA